MNVSNIVFAECWYLCDLTDTSVDETLEPDWSRVPVERRERVRDAWRAKQEKPSPQRVKLWGPQIAFFARQPYYAVEVIGEITKSPES